MAAGNNWAKSWSLEGDKHEKRALEILTDLGTQYGEGKLDEKTLKEEEKKRAEQELLKELRGGAWGLGGVAH